MLNWIPDRNRWNLPEPPEWFRKALWDLDSMLVVLPSRARRLYILARRREGTRRAPMLVKIQDDQMRKLRGSDGDMLAQHNLLKVDVIKGTIGGSWSPTIITELKERDTWAHGAQSLADRADEADRKSEERERSQFLDDTEMRAKDSWRSLQARTGQRNHHARNSGLRAKSSSSRTAGSGIAESRSSGIVITG